MKQLLENFQVVPSLAAVMIDATIVNTMPSWTSSCSNFANICANVSVGTFLEVELLRIE